MRLLLVCILPADEDHVLPLGFGVLYRIEGDGRRIRIVILLDDLAPELLGVVGELLDGARPEGVAGREDHRLPVLHDTVRDLRDGGGLPGSVDADEHDDGGSLLLGEPSVEVEFVYLEDVPDGVLDRELHDLLQGVGAVVLLPDKVLAHAGLDLLDDGVRHVCFEEDDLQLVQDLVEGVLLDPLPGVSDGGLGGLAVVFGLLLLLLLELQHLFPGELRLLLRGFGSRCGCGLGLRLCDGLRDLHLLNLRFRRLNGRLGCQNLFGLLMLVHILFLELPALREEAFHLGFQRLEHDPDLTGSLRPPGVSQRIPAGRHRTWLRGSAGPR